MKKLIPLIFLVFISSESKSQSIDDIRNDCSTIGVFNKVKLSVAPFSTDRYSALSSGSPSFFYDKLINTLNSVNCFDTYKPATSSVLEGTQAYIIGDFFDYFTSEGKIGQPRLEFSVELRTAISQELIKTKHFKYKGKIYLGVGQNKSLETIIDKAIADVVIFIYQNLGELKTLKKLVLEDDIIGNQIKDTIENIAKPIRRKSVLKEMEDDADQKRTRDWKNRVSYSEYHNDTVYYKKYPKSPNDEFLSYKINGKNYLFKNHGSMNEEAINFNASGNIDDGIKILIFGNVGFCNLQIQMFYPIKFPLVRRFHFGDDKTYDASIVSGKEKTTFKIDICSDFAKISDWSNQKKAQTQYNLIASNEEKYLKESNVESGYMDILNFETGTPGGKIEVFFKFKTKPYVNDKGKKIAAANIEGRFRFWGSFFYIKKFTDN